MLVNTELTHDEYSARNISQCDLRERIKHFSLDVIEWKEWKSAGSGQAQRAFLFDGPLGQYLTTLAAPIVGRE